MNNIFKIKKLVLLSLTMAVSIWCSGHPQPENPKPEHRHNDTDMKFIEEGKKDN